MKNKYVVILMDNIKPIANPFAIKCNRCGQELQISLPIHVAMINSIQKAFLREHKTCEFPPAKQDGLSFNIMLEHLLTDRTDSVFNASTEQVPGEAHLPPQPAP